MQVVHPSILEKRYYQQVRTILRSDVQVLPKSKELNPFVSEELRGTLNLILTIYAGIGTLVGLSFSKPLKGTDQGKYYNGVHFIK